MKNLSSKKYTTPLSIVLFGGTGDLARAKLLPALVDLYVADGLPDTFVVIGLSRKSMTDQEYREFVRSTVAETDNRSEKDIHNFCAHVRYLSGNFDESSTYDIIKESLIGFDTKIGSCSSKMFYLAIPPDFYSRVFGLLKKSGIMDLHDGGNAWSRLLIEKPFGRDLESAKALDSELRNLFADDQIYCIDHYLEKEAIENILPIRFETASFTDIWDARHIESMYIRILEKGDASVRGAFYDKVGALRDVGQNHILEILALLIMNRPHTVDAQMIHTLRAEALEYFSHQMPHIIIAGQYDGFIGTVGVDSHSRTETYFKIETKPDSGVWRDVTFTIESGKALTESIADVVIVFREGHNKHKNILRLGFSPTPYAIYTEWNKKTLSETQYEPHDIELTLPNKGTPEGYERVLFDCSIGDQTRFVSSREIKAAWEFITPVLESFKAAPLLSYKKGDTGPLPQ